MVRYNVDDAEEEQVEEKPRMPATILALSSKLCKQVSFLYAILASTSYSLAAPHMNAQIGIFLR